MPCDPSKIGIGKPAARRRQVAGEHTRARETLAEFGLPVAHDPFDAGLWRLPPAAPDDDGQGLAIEEEIADEVRAEKTRGTGEEQVLAIHRGNVDHGWSVLRLEEPARNPSHAGKPENVGVSRRLSQCPHANHRPARQMVTLALQAPFEAAPQIVTSGVVVAGNSQALGRAAAHSRISVRIAAARRGGAAGPSAAVSHSAVTWRRPS